MTLPRLLSSFSSVSGSSFLQLGFSSFFLYPVSSHLTRVSHPPTRLLGPLSLIHLYAFSLNSSSPLFPLSRKPSVRLRGTKQLLPSHTVACGGQEQALSHFVKCALSADGCKIKNVPGSKGIYLVSKLLLERSAFLYLQEMEDSKKEASSEKY